MTGQPRPWPPPDDLGSLPKDGWTWTDFRRTVVDFARVLARAQAQSWPPDEWEYWEKPWQWDNEHALWVQLGQPRGTEPLWPRFVHALETGVVDDALAEWNATGELAPLWWENDLEWSAFIRALASAGHIHLPRLDVPVLNTETGEMLSRWAYDDHHALWVALNRPHPKALRWPEFVARADPHGPVDRGLRVVKDPLE